MPEDSEELSRSDKLLARSAAHEMILTVMLAFIAHWQFSMLISMLRGGIDAALGEKLKELGAEEQYAFRVNLRSEYVRILDTVENSIRKWPRPKKTLKRRFFNWLAS
jgi:hypothetical protein